MIRSLSISRHIGLNHPTATHLAHAALDPHRATLFIPSSHTTEPAANTPDRGSAPRPSPNDPDPSLTLRNNSRNDSSDETDDDQPWHDSYGDGNDDDNDDYNEDDDENEDEDDPTMQAYKLADQASEEGDFRVALKHINHALNLFHQNPVPDPDDHADLLEFRAMVYHDLGRHKKAIRDLTKAIDLWEQRIPRDLESLTLAYCDRALVHRYLGERKHALEDLKTAIEICELLDPPNVLLLASHYGTRGVIYHDLEKYDLAEREYDTSIAYTQSIAPQGIESLIMYYAVRARCRAVQGNQQGAIDDINKSFELYDSLETKDPELREGIERHRKEVMSDTIYVQPQDGT